MHQDDLQNIQTLLAHHERQIQDLSEIVTAQRREIDILGARLDKTSRKLSDMELASGEGSGDSLSASEQAIRDKPPHY